MIDIRYGFLILFLAGLVMIGRHSGYLPDPKGFNSQFHLKLGANSFQTSPLTSFPIPPSRSGQYAPLFQTGTVTTTTYRAYFPLIYRPHPPTTLYLPLLLRIPPPVPCPPVSQGQFHLIKVEHSGIDHPDYLHADLNLALRGYQRTSALLNLIDYDGDTDWDAPQLAGIFSDKRLPKFTAAYQVNDWLWDCGPEALHGCRGDPLSLWPTTMLGFRTAVHEPLSIPSRQTDINENRDHALILYAEEKRITLTYLREDTVAHGYAVHIENICVDPALLALYQAQVNAQGYRRTDKLPALSNGQILGWAASDEIRVAIRDRGTFMDPRSRKDWWVDKASQGIFRRRPLIP